MRGQDEARRHLLTLMRYGDQRGDDWADIIDFLTMHPEAASSAAARRDRRKRPMGRTPTGDGNACWSPPWRARHQWIRHPRREGRDGFAMTIGVTVREYRELEAGLR